MVPEVPVEVGAIIILLMFSYFYRNYGTVSRTAAFSVLGCYSRNIRVLYIHGCMRILLQSQSSL